MELTQEIARELIDLDKESGIMTWRIRGYKWFKSKADCMTWNKKHAGKRALNNSDNEGYLIGSVLGKQYKSHRLIWFMETGQFPEQIDHINGVRCDNGWSNLRNVSDQENKKNIKTPKTNTSGRIGVCWDGRTNKWYARIAKKYIGTFDTFDEACEARAEAEKEHGFHPNHGRG